MCRGGLLIRQPQPGATQTVSKGQQAHGHELPAFPLMHNFIPSLCVSLSHWHLWEASVLVSFEGWGTTGSQPTELQWPVFQIIKIEENLLKLIIVFFMVQIHTHSVLFWYHSCLFHITSYTWLTRTLPHESCYPKWRLGHVAFRFLPVQSLSFRKCSNVVYYSFWFIQCQSEPEATVYHFMHWGLLMGQGKRL